MRNDEIFASLPSLDDVPRSKFDRPSTLHTTFDSGKLVPIFLDSVLPGDTFDMKTVSNVRMTTPIVPVMDSCYLDTYFFFVPSRLCWNRWKEFCGENPRSNWTNEMSEDLLLPHIAYRDRSTWETEVFNPNYLAGTLVDYFGLPYNIFRQYYGYDVGEDRYKENWDNPDLDNRDYQCTFDMLPFEAYNLIWNEFFRDQNIQDPTPLLLQNTSDSDAEAVNGIYYHTNQLTSLPDVTGDYGDVGEYLSLKNVCKFHDYFTSCLPQPQKHAPVIIPGFDSFNQNVDVVATYNTDRYHLGDAAVAYGSLLNENPYNYNGNIGLRNGYTAIGNSSDMTDKPYITPINLIGQYSGALPNINDLRNAFALQRLFEKDARGGSRYIESLRVHFGVTSPDARLQRPEYIGGKRIDINMSQVVQTSSTDSVSPQGNVAGLSHTFDVDDSFFKSFTEFGYIIGLACVRPIHSYQTGIPRMFSKSRRFDFYYPSLAFIGEQPVYKEEIWANPYLSNLDDGESVRPHVFGYQEAWAEYRYKPNTITGKMRSNIEGSLDIWHYGDYYSVSPNLSSSFIIEDGSTVARSLAVLDEPQFFGDFHFDLKCTREMPLYSVPGLVDHY